MPCTHREGEGGGVGRCMIVDDFRRLGLISFMVVRRDDHTLIGNRVNAGKV